MQNLRQSRVELLWCQSIEPSRKDVIGKLIESIEQSITEIETAMEPLGAIENVGGSSFSSKHAKRLGNTFN